MGTRETPEPILKYEIVRLRTYFRGDKAEYWVILWAWLRYAASDEIGSWPTNSYFHRLRDHASEGERKKDWGVTSAIMKVNRIQW